MLSFTAINIKIAATNTIKGIETPKINPRFDVDVYAPFTETLDDNIGAPAMLDPATSPASSELLISAASVEESGDTVPATIVEPYLECLWHNLPRPKRGLTNLILPKICKMNREKINENCEKVKSNVIK